MGSKAIIFARWTYWVAGIYGLLALAPLYLSADRYFSVALAGTQPVGEVFYYGFVGVALAWQLAFLMIGCDPVRCRPIMIATFLEKFSFTGATSILYVRGRAPGDIFAASLIDGLLGALFVIAWYRLSAEAASVSPAHNSQRS